MGRRRWCACAWLAVACSLAGTALADDGYAERFREAAALEEEERFAEALDLLDDLVADYPQDYALVLRLGWLAYRAEKYARAEVYYATAAELSGGALDPRLGLAWTDLMRGRRNAARTRLEALAAEFGDDPRVQEALEAADAPPEGSISAGGSALFMGYPGYDVPLWGAGFVAGIGGRHGHLVAGVTYRFTRFTLTLPGPSPAVPGGGLSWIRYSYNQHELYPFAGLSYERFGISAHYGLIDDGSDTPGDGHAFGLVGRYSPLGDLTLETSYTAFTGDEDVFRAALSWRIPVVGPLVLCPGGALQVSGGTARGSGSLMAGVADERGEFWLGARAGREVRPVYLTVPAAYNVSGIIPYGGSLSGRVRLAPEWWLAGSFETNRHTAVDDDGNLSDDGYFGLVGSLGITFEH